jgi:prepilin peptidase CpaA
MPFSQEMMKLILLIPIAFAVIYFDVRYRRIPNVIVISTLVAGVIINSAIGSWGGMLGSAEGFALAFVPMFLMHLFGAMGAGDVKLSGAVGAVLGVTMVPLALIIIVMMGAVLAIYSMIRSGRVFTTLHGVLRIFVGIMPGWEMPRFAMPPDRRHTIPYGVAIMIGSLIAVAVFQK